MFAGQRDLAPTLSVDAVDSTAAEPAYVQVLRGLQKALATGELSSGQLVPAERQLCRTFHVSRATLRRALEELVRSGHFMRVPGVGTFVADQRLRLGDSLSFTDRVSRAGLSPSSRVISFGVEPPIEDVNRALRLDPQEELLKLRRLRLVDGRPVMVQSSYLQARRFQSLLDEDMASRSLYRTLLDKFGIQIHSVQETLRASLMPEGEAHLLGSAAASPALRREFLAFDLRGQPVEYCHAYARGDAVSYRFVVHAGEGPAIDMVIAVPLAADRPAGRLAKEVGQS
jgi:GntR family transcriptional regulator